jgi:hypothetical protein
MLRPGAVTQGKIDRTRSFWERLIEKPTAAGVNITQEGSAIIAVTDAGNPQEVVRMSQGTGKEQFLGICISDFRRITDFVECESCTIPLVAPFTFQLKWTTPVVAPAATSSFYVTDTLGNTYTDVSPGAPAAAVQFNVSVGGLMTFHLGAAGRTINLIRYTYIPTTLQLDMMFHQRPYTAQGQAALGQTAVAQGYCEVYTTQYVSQDAFTLRGQVYTAASGKFSTTNPGGNTMVAGRVISLPAVGDVFLGVSYNVSPGGANAW